MGRPLNKKYFGSGAGNQIKVRAKIGSNAEGDGIIVSQRGSKKFKVTVGANTGDCNLVDKADGALGPNEMSMTVLTDGGVLKRVIKISAHTVTANDGLRYGWNFAASNTDDKVQIEEVETGVTAPVITISAQPANLTVSENLPAVFTVTATVTQGGVLGYQWQYNDGTGWVNFNQVGGIYEGWNTNELTVTVTPAAIDGYQFRAIVTSVGAAPVTSAAATITVTPEVEI